MKVREFRVQVVDRTGAKVHDSKVRDRVLMLQDLDRLTLRNDFDIAMIKVDIVIADTNQVETKIPQ